MNHPVPVLISSISVIKMDNFLPAGFPVSHMNSIHTRIDLNDELLLNKNASYLFRIRGNSMNGIGIFDGDTIIVDRSIEPHHGHIVLAVLNQEYTVKRLFKQDRRIRLLPENPDYDPIEICDGDELQIWGVVTVNIRKLFCFNPRSFPSDD